MGLVMRLYIALLASFARNICLGRCCSQVSTTIATRCPHQYRCYCWRFGISYSQGRGFREVYGPVWLLGQDLWYPESGKGEQMCYDYWCKYRKLYPNFDLFKTNLPLSRCVPIYVHGDEGQHYRKAAVMVIQWQSVIGRGTSLNNPNIHGNLSEKKYFVNQRGITLATRFLCAVMPKDSCNTLMIFM